MSAPTLPDVETSSSPDVQQACQDVGLSQVADQELAPVQDPPSHLLAQVLPNGRQPHLSPDNMIPIRRQAHNQTSAESPKGVMHTETTIPPTDPADKLLHRPSVNIESHQRVRQFSHQANRQSTIDFDQPQIATRVGRPTGKNQDGDLEKNAAYALPAPEENLFSEPSLNVVDVPLDGSEATLELLVNDAAEGIDTSLRALRQHPENVARIFDFTPHMELYKNPIQQSLIRHFDDAYCSPHVDLSLMVSDLDSYYGSNVLGADIDAISSQLNQSLTSLKLHKIWARTTLRLSDASYELEFANSSFCCVEVGGNRLLVSVVNHSRASVASAPRIDMSICKNSRLSDRLLSREAWANLPTGAPKICAAALTLDFLLMDVYMQPASSFNGLWLLVPPESQRIQTYHMLSNIRHKNSSIPQGEDSEITLQFEECEEILQEVQHVTEAVLFLLAALNLASSSSPSQPNFESLHGLRYLRLRETCSQRRLNCERRIERINRTLETRNKLLNIHESTSVKRLTILAAVFLPASLASSFLSMSQRFHELDLILFDWLGVFVLVSSVTIVLYFAVKVILHVKSKTRLAYWSPAALWAFDREPWLRIVAPFQLLVYLLIWAVVLACFVLGMFRSPSLGGKVLGYGIAGVLGFVVLSVIAFFLIPFTGLLDGD
ncbi:hypothetical protein AYL99_10437 [Fonsecaea erecta]|uniref:Uncharacterized protein n=1 Tax=Fonsecaea erecta TaxID=1367422 RepID=A0A178Z6R9_9EURO|nr:hypothetical protein AYL99_10437 [Fonsecaea erecta]OAP55464.1 hypothetical protein AYL99_10437 [Fonsecaea erecta]